MCGATTHKIPNKFSLTISQRRRMNHPAPYLFYNLRLCTNHTFRSHSFHTRFLFLFHPRLPSKNLPKIAKFVRAISPFFPAGKCYTFFPYRGNKNKAGHWHWLSPPPATQKAGAPFMADLYILSVLYFSQFLRMPLSSFGLAGYQGLFSNNGLGQGKNRMLALAVVAAAILAVTLVLLLAGRLAKPHQTK